MPFFFSLLRLRYCSVTIDAELCCISEFKLMAEVIDGPESYESMKSTSATNITAITTEEYERCASYRT